MGKLTSTTRLNTYWYIRSKLELVKQLGKGSFLLYHHTPTDMAVDNLIAKVLYGSTFTNGKNL